MSVNEARRRRHATDLLPGTAAIAAALWVILVFSVRHDPQEFPTNATIAIVAAITLIASAGLAVAGRLPAARAWLDHNPAATAWVLALHAGFALSLTAALLLVTPSAAERATGWILPVLNKRWLIALYYVAILTVLILPAGLEWWRTASQEKESARPVSVPPPSSRSVGWPRSVIGLAAIVLMAWYLAGPPWHLDHYRRSIDWHEQMRLGGLQAISQGSLPFIDAAAFPHGPGTQLLLYGVMRATRHFDLVGFRMGWATLHLLGFLAVAIVAYWLCGFVRATVILVLALVYSPLSFFGTAPDGTFAGMYGWANALRYAAPLAVVPAFARIITSSQRRSALVMLGVLWAIGSWFAQESLTTTLVALGLVVTLLCSTNTASIRGAARAAGYLLAGFAGVAAAVLAAYAWHGAAREFVFNYFVIARMVVSGWSNMWWPAQDIPSARYTYYLTLPFLLVLAVCAVWRLRPLRLETRLDSAAVVFLAFVCVQLACYQTALLRSDSSHLANTMIALPFIIVLASTELPAWLGLRSWPAVAVRASVLAAVLVSFPLFRDWLPWGWVQLVTQPALKYSKFQTEERHPYEGRVAYRRIPQSMYDEPEVGNAGMSVQAFMQLATEIREIVGRRKTLIADLGHVYIADGLLYFFADLVPAPALPDRDTMRVNDDMRRMVVDRIRSQPGEFECFIGSTLDTPEAQAFLDVHPRVQRFQKPMSTYATLHILVVDDEPGRGEIGLVVPD